MKNLFLLLVSLLVLNGTFAQNNNGKAKKEVPTAKNTKGANAKGTDAKGADAKGAKLKKDGTPDMRYKANKAENEPKKATGKLKKDGTPDMRHKENKKATTK